MTKIFLVACYLTLTTPLMIMSSDQSEHLLKDRRLPEHLLEEYQLEEYRLEDHQLEEYLLEDQLPGDQTLHGVLRPERLHDVLKDKPLYGSLNPKSLRRYPPLYFLNKNKYQKIPLPEAPLYGVLNPTFYRPVAASRETERLLQDKVNYLRRQKNNEKQRKKVRLKSGNSSRKNISELNDYFDYLVAPDLPETSTEAFADPEFEKLKVNYENLVKDFMALAFKQGVSEADSTTTDRSLEDGVTDHFNIELKNAITRQDIKGSTSAILETSTISSGTSFVFLERQTATATLNQNCFLRENLSECKIFLCRMMRSMLAVPFPTCYG